VAAVLGIDAAWTEQQPSGVALLEQQGTSWSCVTIAPSYESFLSIAAGQPVNWEERRRGNCPGALVNSSRALLTGNDLCAIACDIPLAVTSVRSRRQADNEVSIRYGVAGCSTHSPGPSRPGFLSELLRDGFMRAGFPLITTGTGGNCGGLIEVFPHVALLGLCDRDFRIPYKVHKSIRYWPSKTVAERLVLLCSEMSMILTCLKERIRGIDLCLPDPATCSALSQLKQYEDTIDALVCAWVGLEFIEGRGCPLGDAQAAIWVPQISMQQRAAKNAQRGKQLGR
jgi:predicted RNase H-like nuclease